MIYRLGDILKFKYGKNQKKVECVNGNYYMMKFKYSIARLYNLFPYIGNGDYNFSAHVTIKNYKKGCFNWFWPSCLNTIGYIESRTYYENNTMYGSAECRHYLYIDKKFSTYIRYQSQYGQVGFFRPNYCILSCEVNINNCRNIIDATYNCCN